MTQRCRTFDHPDRIDSFQRHRDLQMNVASLEIYYPELGRTEQVSKISNWRATWQHSHNYNPDAAPLLLAGTVLLLEQ